TLAGADLDLARALRVMTGPVGLARDRALAMATRLPGRVLGGAAGPGRLLPGGPADFVHLSNDLHLGAVWRGGRPLPLSPPCTEPAPA
ncbi:MAG: N-acetylglucosamine-6-phosphate deacetylase, partial [Alphaproteobacteria bacterium HGW-Alphaproteobacteria-5]